MTDPASTVETITYRLLIVVPCSRHLLMVGTLHGPRLPRVCVPLQGRHAAELQAACLKVWGLHVFVLQFFSSEQEEDARYTVVELLATNTNKDLKAVPYGDVLQSELREEHHETLASILAETASRRLSEIGWIDEAIAWVESATACSLTSKKEIQQLNAGIQFSLVRFPMQDGRQYWLKSTGAPNTHEFAVTGYLSAPDARSSAYLPRLIASHPDWNAWLMAGDALPVSEIPRDALSALPILKDAVVSFARLQIATLASVDDILQRGAADQRLEKLQMDIEELLDHIRIAMNHQTSTKVARIESGRLLRVRALVEQACKRVEDLSLPTSLVHGDLNRGNILRQEHCLFIDWSEAYIGCPLVSLQHLLLLNRVDNDAGRRRLDGVLKALYCDEWSSVCDISQMNFGLRYMPLLAAVSALYGRGDWVHSSEKFAPHRFPYARTLARHMDRAARELEQERAPCFQ